MKRNSNIIELRMMCDRPSLQNGSFRIKDELTRRKFSLTMKNVKSVSRLRLRELDHCPIEDIGIFGHEKMATRKFLEDGAGNSLGDEA